MSVPPPFVPGGEIAGIVTEVVADVDSIEIDERVTGTCLVGAFAEEVVGQARRRSDAHPCGY